MTISDSIMFFFFRLLELLRVSNSDGQLPPMSLSPFRFHSAHTEATPKSQRVSESFAKEVRDIFGGKKLDALRSARAEASDFPARSKSEQSPPTGMGADGSQRNKHVRMGAG